MNGCKRQWLNLEKCTVENLLHEYPLGGFVAVGVLWQSPLRWALFTRGLQILSLSWYISHSIPRICNARYIKADWLESVVWGKVKSVLAHPELYLMKMREYNDAEHRQSGHSRPRNKSIESVKLKDTKGKKGV